MLPDIVERLQKIIDEAGLTAAERNVLRDAQAEINAQRACREKLERDLDGALRACAEFIKAAS